MWSWSRDLTFRAGNLKKNMWKYFHVTFIMCIIIITCSSIFKSPPSAYRRGRQHSTGISNYLNSSLTHWKSIWFYQWSYSLCPPLTSPPWLVCFVYMWTRPLLWIVVHNIIYSWSGTINVAQAPLEYCPSVSWPSVHINVICEVY